MIEYKNVRPAFRKAVDFADKVASELNVKNENIKLVFTYLNEGEKGLTNSKWNTFDYKYDKHVICISIEQSIEQMLLVIAHEFKHVNQATYKTLTFHNTPKQFDTFEEYKAIWFEKEAREYSTAYCRRNNVNLDNVEKELIEETEGDW